MSAKKPTNKIEIERIYDAPVKMVWDAWTDDKQVVKWWGPRGFTITTHDKDLRTGGHWHYTMHGPDGKDYENTTKYHVVEKQQRLVYDHGGHKDRPPLFQVTATFTDVGGGKTKLNMSMAFDTPETATEMKKFIKQAGGNGTWDRLAEFLAEKSSGEDIFVIQRSFEAPIESVFDMWTNKDHFQHWMGPTGSTMQFIECNIKPGGNSFYKMDFAGMTMYGKIEYKEISKPNKLVYKQWFSNAEGGLGKHPMAPTWPTYMLTTVNFFAETPETTRIQLKWEIFGDATKEERATFNAAKAGMTGGWTGSFDKLEELLERFA
jgi:uncharacterized protein YndB with AHSA1/START domain